MRAAQGRTPITGDVIKQKARDYFKEIPACRGKDEPTFSNGWLQGFQHRKGIRCFKQHGEESSVPETSAEDMAKVREAL